MFYKTIADPYVGRLSLFKVLSGKIVPGMEMYNLDNDKKEKINHIYTICGKKQIELEALNAGDIGAFSKLSDTLTNHILSSAKDKVDFEKIHFARAEYLFEHIPEIERRRRQTRQRHCAHTTRKTRRSCSSVTERRTRT